MTGNLESLLLVALKLGDLREQFVFVGGSVLELLISDPAQPPVRPTLDGRRELAEEVARSEPELREYLAVRLRRLLDERDFIDALPGLPYPDPASQARLPLVVERLERMAAPA